MTYSTGEWRRGVSLIELLVVIGIMGLIISMLLPALNAVRESANEMACKNNVYQLNSAMHHFKSVHKRIPEPNRWTIDLLPYLEERPLAQALRGVDPTTVPDAKYRPAVFSCTAQPEVRSTIGEIPVCHFMLVIDPALQRRGLRIAWGITDRPADLPSGRLPPWYVGPEMHPAEFRLLVQAEKGPHRGGAFFP
jgi:prepilin-type N-terminal cleavage/methylation domain-containing protein